jgi:type 1 glutamine amidotransferase
VDAPESAAVIRHLAKDGDGQVRLAAIRDLGEIGLGEDAGDLMKLAASSDEPVAAAAGQALRRMPAEVIRGSLPGWLEAGDPAAQAAAIHLAADRDGAVTAEALLRIAGEDGNPNRNAAAAALGTAAAAADFGRVVKAYGAAVGSPVGKELQGAVWMLARRQPDYDQAARRLRTAAGEVPPSLREPLESMAKKLETLKPDLPPDRVGNPPASGKRSDGLLLPGKHDAVTPKRFEVAAYLNCGPQAKAAREGIAIECLNGKPWDAGPGVDPSLSVAFADASLDFSIRGLEGGVDYLLGMTWWDADARGRRQAVFIHGREVLPDTRAVAYDEGKPTPARLLFKLLPEHLVGGELRLGIRKLAGPNAVASELWIMKRREPAAEKQVLLVSGQDFPGHHWRKTGPLVAAILEADPRMEVTICESPHVLGLAHLDAYDMVFLHFKNYRESLPSTPAMHDGLDRFVRDGGGMCLSHFACGAMEEWPPFVELAGRVWDGQGHDPRGPFTVRVVDQHHPVTRGLDDFQTDDELYFCLKGSPEIHLLCDAHSKVKKAGQPQAFVFQPGKGRVFMSTLGHDGKAYEASEVQQLYRQAAAWAAGLEPRTIPQ